MAAHVCTSLPSVLHRYTTKVCCASSSGHSSTLAPPRLASSQSSLSSAHQFSDGRSIFASGNQNLPIQLHADSARREGLTIRARASVGTTRLKLPKSSGRRRGSAAEQQKQLASLVEELLQLAVKTGPLGALRVFQGLQAVASVGSEWLLGQLQRRGSNAPSAASASPGPVELRRLFERLGATYIKLGQFIASAPTLFPAEYVLEFQKCLDRTPPIPFSQVKTILGQELGRPLESVFQYVDPKPLACASIAQVHAARLKGSGREVVIKVLKPGVEDTLKADLNFLYAAARVLEFLNPELSRASLVAIVGDIRKSMLEEVDFRKEAVNIQSFRSYVETAGLSAQATAPVVHHHCTTRRMLTMERLYGVPLTDLEAIRSRVASPETTLISALNVWFGSLVACESFHADVHAGNLLVLDDGRVGFIDFGIVGRISPATWSAIQTFLTSVGGGQYKAMATALARMGATDVNVDVDGFANDLERLFETVDSLDPEVLISASRGTNGTTIASASVAMDEREINALLVKVVQIGEEYGIRFPREFGLLLKQLLYFDRYTRLLAPSLNVLDDERVLFSGAGGFGQPGSSAYPSPGYAPPSPPPSTYSDDSRTYSSTRRYRVTNR